MSEESNPENTSQIHETKITTRLLEAFNQYYTPEATGEPELRTTLDILEEIAPVADVSKNDIQNALQLAGYTIRYCESGPFWVLYQKK